jgi:hypothetical protein
LRLDLCQRGRESNESRIGFRPPIFQESGALLHFGAGCKLIYPLRHRRSWQSVSGKILLRLGPRCGEPSASNPN